ncbi:MAG: site-specific integrase, partial [Phycisphaerales bacterium]
VVRLDGKDIYLGKHGSPESRAEYNRVIAEWLTSRRAALLAEPGQGPPPDLTVAELVDAFFEWADGYYVKNGRPTSEVNALNDAVRPLVKLYGLTRAADFGPLALKAVREDMVSSDLSRKHINARVNRIRRVFRWGVENQLVASSVLEGLRAVAPLKKGRCGVREAPPVKPAPESLVEPVLAIAPPQIAAMVRLQLLTGMRPGEVVRMRARDIDTTGQTWRYVPEEHKTEHHGRERVIYLGPKAREVLRPFLGLEIDAYLFSPRAVMAARSVERRKERRTPMTPSQAARRPKRDGRRRPGERYTTESYGRAIAELCARAFPHPTLAGRDDLDEAERLELSAWRRAHHWSPNRLRHSAATELRRQAGIDTARVVLGHSSAGVTEIYAERDLARAAEVMERVG